MQTARWLRGGVPAPTWMPPLVPREAGASRAHSSQVPMKVEANATAFVGVSFNLNGVMETDHFVYMLSKLQRSPSKQIAGHQSVDPVATNEFESTKCCIEQQAGQHNSSCTADEECARATVLTCVVPRAAHCSAIRVTRSNIAALPLITTLRLASASDSRLRLIRQHHDRLWGFRPTVCSWCTKSVLFMLPRLTTSHEPSPRPYILGDTSHSKTAFGRHALVTHAVRCGAVQKCLTWRQIA